jgi:hypothetical protein
MTVNTIYIVWSQGYHTGIVDEVTTAAECLWKGGEMWTLCPETNCKDNGAQVSSGGKTVDRVEG